LTSPRVGAAAASWLRKTATETSTAARPMDTDVMRMSRLLEGIETQDIAFRFSVRRKKAAFVGRERAGTRMLGSTP
jgi:hypothetical protein